MNRSKMAELLERDLQESDDLKMRNIDSLRRDVISDDELAEWLDRSSEHDLDRLRQLVEADDCFPREALYSRRILSLLKRVDDLESRLADHDHTSATDSKITEKTAPTKDIPPST